MAEGLLRHEGGAEFEVHSAGLLPTSVRPEAIQAMREIGIDISGHTSKSLDEFVGQNFDTVITVCDNANEKCPVFMEQQNAYIRASWTRRRKVSAVTITGSASFARFVMRCRRGYETL